MTRPRDTLSVKEYEEGLIAALPDSEFGRAFFSMLRKELETKVAEYFVQFKICNRDLRDDFRYRAGFIAAMKWVLQEPERLRKKINSQQ